MLALSVMVFKISQIQFTHKHSFSKVFLEFSKVFLSRVSIFNLPSSNQPSTNSSKLCKIFESPLLPTKIHALNSRQRAHEIRLSIHVQNPLFSRTYDCKQ